MCENDIMITLKKYVFWILFSDLAIKLKKNVNIFSMIKAFDYIIPIYQYLRSRESFSDEQDFYLSV